MRAADLLSSLRTGGAVSRRRIYHDAPWPDESKRIPMALYSAAADRLSIDPRALRALAIVETQEVPFIDDAPVMRFEAHKWRLYRQATGSAMTFDKMKNSRDLYRRYEQFLKMAALQFGAAVRAHSWGAFQIMGFNHGSCGFENIEEFKQAMMSVEGQVTAIERFIRDQRAVHQALTCQDPHAVGRHYNGSAYRRNNYHIKWAAALEVPFNA